MIRAYTNSDLDKLVQLLRLNTPKYFAASEEADYINYLNHELEDYFVFEVDKEILGAGGLNYFPTEKSARISWDMIHPNHHGRGIGKKLTHHRIALGRKNTKVQTLVVRTSQHVYQFYEKMGFTLEKTQGEFWAPGFDLYQMTMDVGN